MAAGTPLTRLALGAGSVADDLGFVALNGVAGALGDITADYRVIGGHMVTMLAARWQLGVGLYRETGDVDLGIPPVVACDRRVVSRLSQEGDNLIRSEQRFVFARHFAARTLADFRDYPDLRTSLVFAILLLEPISPEHLTELAAEHRGRTEELAQLKAATPGHIANDPDLLARVPQLPLVLGALPEALQRSLYDAFQLQVRYHRPRHEVTIRITIRADALPGLARLVKEAAGQPGTPTGIGQPDDARFHVLGAPGRIRTCAHGSGGHIHVQR